MASDKCSNCNGTGTVEKSDGPPHYGPCPKCKGSGKK